MTLIRGLLALLVLSLLGLSPTAAQAGGGYYGGGNEHCIVSHEEMELIILRAQRNNYSLIQKRFKPGECGVHVVDGCRHGWCPVRQGPFHGWVHSANLAPVSPPIYCVDRVDAGWTLNLYAMPSKQTRVTVSLSDHECGIELLAQKVGHWVRIRARGVEGWVSVTSIRQAY